MDTPSVEEAMSGNEAAKWTAAMKQEVEAIHKHEMWEEMAAPPGARIVETKWVLKKKRNENGSVVRYKARLKARGCTEVPGLEIREAFAPVAQTATIRILLAQTLQNNLVARHYDIENAYFHVPIEDEVYIKAPVAVNVKGGNLLRLRKSIYGLEQATRRWGEVLATALAKRGLKRSYIDPALFINKDKTEFLAVHDDDLLHVSNRESDFGKWLASTFTVKDLGRPTYLLSMELNWKRDSLQLSQTAYLEHIIDKFLPRGNGTASVPMSSDERPGRRKNADPAANLRKYQAAVGSLLYAALVTRPDIMFSVCCLSQFVSNPAEDHMRLVENVFRYLAGTKNLMITYHRDDRNHASTPLLAYSDASLANSLWNRKGFSGYTAFYHGCPVAWKTTKQPLAAFSATEVGYISLADAVSSTTSLHFLLGEISVDNKYARPKIYSDIGLRILAKNPPLGCQFRSKHLGVRYYFTREAHERKKIELKFVFDGKQNPAYLLTNAVEGDHFSCLLPQFLS